MGDEQRDEIATLHVELARMQRRLADLEAERGEPRSDRRGFLKLAAGAAAGAVVAGVGSASPAGATTGNPVLLGQTSFPTANADTTAIESPSPTSLMNVTVAARNSSTGAYAPSEGLRVAIYGTSSGPDDTHGYRIGVSGRADSFGDTEKGGIGVYGAAETGNFGGFAPHEPIGVLGYAGGGGVGVRGEATDAGSRAVHGRALAADAIGVHGEATVPGALGVFAFSGMGTALRVEGKLHHAAAPTVGRPAAVGTIGEQHRDSLGDMYLCVATGEPATWRKVAAQHPLFANAGGSVNLLASPFRVVDTRLLGAQNHNGQPIDADTDVQFQITGVGGAAGVPTGARGIIGNATAVEPAGPGYLSLFPTTFSGTSNINYVPNQVTANAVTCALDVNGRLKVRSAVTATHFLLDIAGFLF